MRTSKGTFIALCSVGLCTLSALSFLLSIRSSSNRNASSDVDNAQVRRLFVDIGRVDPNSHHSTSVSIENNTDATWNVAEIQADCGCLVHDISHETIDPQEEAVLSLDFTAPSNPGRIRRNVNVTFREEHAPSFLVELNGFVEPWCYSEPKSLDFGTVSLDDGSEIPTRTAALKFKRADAFTTLRPPIANEWIKVEYVPGASQKSTIAETGLTVPVRFSAVFKKDATPGVIQDLVVFESAGNPTERYEIPVRAVVASPIKATPPRLFLGARKAGEEVRSRIVLQSKLFPSPLTPTYLQEHVRITHDLGDLLTLSHAEGESPGSIDIDCLLKMPAKERVLVGNIQIAVDDVYPLKVLVSGRVADPEHPADE